ncbi:MAG: hypothetical protein ACYSUF_03830, partial [Planctomycetota bacterium]
MTEASVPTPSPDEEARQAGLSPERLETPEEPDVPISPDIPVTPERPEPVVSAKPEAKAPARAKGRRRARGGRRDARRLLGDSGLPDRLRIIVFDVVQRTRLWKSE